MYRCALPVFAALTMSVAPLCASAQSQRNFPQNALRGALVLANASEATLNGQPARLAPGSRIRSQQNMLAMSGSLIGAKLLVHYTIDINGLVKDVWILTPEEAAKRPWPATPAEAQSWAFDPVAQVWTKP